MFPFHADASRRSFLRGVSGGFGALACNALTARPAPASPDKPLAPKKPQFESKVNRVLFPCVQGSPSHVDTFDDKPEFPKRDGQPIGKGRVATAKVMAAHELAHQTNGELWNRRWPASTCPRRCLREAAKWPSTGT